MLLARVRYLTRAFGTCRLFVREVLAVRVCEWFVDVCVLCGLLDWCCLYSFLRILMRVSTT